MGTEVIPPPSERIIRAILQVFLSFLANFVYGMARGICPKSQNLLENDFLTGIHHREGARQNLHRSFGAGWTLRIQRNVVCIMVGVWHALYLAPFPSSLQDAHFPQFARNRASYGSARSDPSTLNSQPSAITLIPSLRFRCHEIEIQVALLRESTELALMSHQNGPQDQRIVHKAHIRNRIGDDIHLF